MFSTFILKLTEVCNLNCTYCYMFNSNDSTHKSVPKIMDASVACIFVDRLVEYADKSGRQQFKIVLHGGEPSLWPVDSFKKLFDKVQEARECFDLRVSMQTNLLQISRTKLSLLCEAGGSFGVSLDGPREYHDRFRVLHTGLGSYDRIRANLDQISDWGLADHLSGFLTVANPDIPPPLYFDWIRALVKPNVSVLWPMHYNYDNLPDRDYGSWFSQLFKLWVDEDDPQIKIRLFRDAIGRLLGYRFHGDSIGNDTLNMLTIETDGQYERHDYFRGYSEDGVRTGFNLLKDDIASVARDPVVKACMNLRDSLPKECQSCRHEDVCGGGFVPNRMQRGERPLARKSVMCDDHMRFFDSVSGYVSQNIGAHR